MVKEANSRIIAELARKWLDKERAEPSSSVFDTYFRYPARDEQDNLANELVRQGHMTADQLEESYIESGCIEHGVVHFDVRVKGGHDRWLCVNPTSGQIDVI